MYLLDTVKGVGACVQRDTSASFGKEGCWYRRVDSCHAVLQAMADLFALQRIQQDILFRNDDYVAPEKAKAIKRMIEKLCSELRGVCCPLVDAFAIPDFILRAPIGLSTAAKDPYAAYLQSIGWD